MPSRKIESMASAIVRSLNRKAARPGAKVASVAASRGLRSPAAGGQLGRGGPRAASASRIVGNRLGGGRGAGGAVNLLVARLASAVERRLGQPSARPAAPPRPLSSARIVNKIAAQVASAIPPAKPSQPVHVASLDATAIAATVAERIQAGRKQADPAAVVASQVLRRLSSLQVAGSTKDAQDFQRRVAAAVAEVLKREGFGAEQGAEKAEAGGTGAAAAAEPAEAGKKRG